jgi:hypothetical protein
MSSQELKNLLHPLSSRGIISRCDYESDDVSDRYCSAADKGGLTHPGPDHVESDILSRQWHEHVIC